MTDESDLLERIPEKKRNCEVQGRKTKYGFGEDNFVNLLQKYPCIIEKNQTPPMKKKKHKALLALEKDIMAKYGVDMNPLQIRKKIENMRSRLKVKTSQRKAKDKKKILLRSHEKNFLELISRKNNTPDLIADVCQNDSPDTHESIDDMEKNGTDASNCQDLQTDLQSEVLEQQKELNIKQSEILALQKQQILLQLDVLKMQKENLALEQTLLVNKIHGRQRKKDVTIVDENGGNLFIQELK